jgi:methionyl-tRNA formyltransferase
MKNYILLTSKSWHDDLFLKLSKNVIGHWFRISNETEFTLENINKISPVYIFIPHWSYLISNEIFNNFNCVVFHMTDLPYGRGGSPLQNLIVRGHKSTKISAIKVTNEIDAGDIYLKSDLDLSGTAHEIFLRASLIIYKMIKAIIHEGIKPLPQEGKIVHFKRRKVEDSNLKTIDEISVLYDYIRMLDCEGYPKAYLENDSIKYEFYNAQYNIETNEIIANVRIFKK